MKILLKLLGLIKQKKRISSSGTSLNLPKKNRRGGYTFTPLSPFQNEAYSISFAIPVHNEGAYYLEPLFQKLLQHLQSEDEIVVLDDFSDEPTTIATLQKYSNKIKYQQRSLNGNFGEQKNYLKSMCTKKYIFQIDADEILEDTFLLHIKYILHKNQHIDLYHVPRINILEGLSEFQKKNNDWNMNEKGWVNYPDYQTRIFKNIQAIKWEGKLHEGITGHKTVAYLPYDDETYSIIHCKHIDRANKQHEFYQSLIASDNEINS